VFGDNKPNCIILDEIDGIDGRTSIDALIGIYSYMYVHIDKCYVYVYMYIYIYIFMIHVYERKYLWHLNSLIHYIYQYISTHAAIIKAPLKSSTKKTKNSKSATQMALIRPLICICNDHYAPALRELRYMDICIFMYAMCICIYMYM
jgi:hypothetical protein